MYSFPTEYEPILRFRARTGLQKNPIGLS